VALTQAGLLGILGNKPGPLAAWFTRLATGGGRTHARVLNWAKGKLTG
jgi:hypothetical protein